MSEDLKTIKEIADEIGVSKQAVWQKIKKESSIDLRQFTSKKGNTVYVDVDGQKAIKSAFFNKTSTTKRQQKLFVDDNVNNSVDGNPEGNEEILFLRNLVSELQSEKKELHKLLDQQQRLALQDKKLLEEYKSEINELKALKMPQEDMKDGSSIRGEAQAGAASVTFHAEAATAPITLARSIRKAGARAAVAFRPSTEVGAYLDFIDEFDMILVMTVEPGFGGQRFLDSTLPKIRQVRKAITDCGAAIQLQVDGGIDKQTILGAAEAGADVFVAGSAVFNSDDPAAQIEALRREANAILNGPKAFLA